MQFKIGDSVKVKSNFYDPDTHCNLEGYQGRIIEITENNYINIKWDSYSLKKLPSAYIKQSEQEGCRWSEYIMSISELDKSAPRDTPSDVARTYSQLEDQFYWYHLGEALGERIHSVVANAASQNDTDVLNAWYDHLKLSLVFPFQAVVSEWQERGPLECDDVITVHRIIPMEESYIHHGLLVHIKNEKIRGHFPLSDVEVKDTQTKNFNLVKDYVMWFANR